MLLWRIGHVLTQPIKNGDPLLKKSRNLYLRLMLEELVEDPSKVSDLWNWVKKTTTTKLKMKFTKRYMKLKSSQDYQSTVKFPQQLIKKQKKRELNSNEVYVDKLLCQYKITYSNSSQHNKKTLFYGFSGYYLALFLSVFWSELTEMCMKAVVGQPNQQKYTLCINSEEMKNYRTQ